ncbi:MAG: PorV/PorQ family protein [Elusimicrobia bacterium]|nr:PorV/PorQ family protein [Elusimicrobiota bacterium]
MRLPRAKALAMTVVYFTFIFHPLYAGVGTNTAAFLKEDIGARMSGMGSAFSAVADDTNLIFVNPAGLNYITSPEIATMYNKSIIDTYYGFLGAVLPLQNCTLGFSYLRYDGGNIEINHLDGTSEKVKAESDSTFILGAGSNLSEEFFFGFNGKFISSELGEKYSASTITGDLGVIFRPVDDRLSIGVSFLNLVGELKYNKVSESLPMTIRSGIAYKVVDLKRHSLLLAFDTVKNKSEDVKFNLGSEYWFSQLLALRVGYKISDSITFGLGLNMLKGQLDYSYVPMLGETTHKVSFSMKFGSVELYDIAEKYYDKGMYNRAISYWSKIDKGEPDYAQAEKRINETKRESDYVQTEERINGTKGEYKDEQQKQQKEEQQLIKGRESATLFAELLQEWNRKHPKGGTTGVSPSQSLETSPTQPVSQSEPIQYQIKPPKEKTNLAITSFEGKNMSSADADIVSDFLRTDLVKTEVFNVVDRGNMEKILAEAAFQQTGCTTSECAVQIGKILNVQKVVTGTLSKLIGVYYVNISMTDVETGKIIYADKAECGSPRDLSIAITNMAIKMASQFSEK